MLLHQYTKQLEENIFEAVKGNANTQILFSISGGDAKKFEYEIMPFNPAELTGSEIGEAIFVQKSYPVKIHTFDRENEARRPNRAKIIKTNSKTRYGRKAESVFVDNYLANM